MLSLHGREGGATGVGHIPAGRPELLGNGLEEEIVGRMEVRLSQLNRMPLSNLSHVVADRLAFEIDGLRLFELQQKVRRALLVSHPEKAVPAPHHQRAWHAVVQEVAQGGAFETEWLKRKGEMERAEKDARHKAHLDDMHATWKAFSNHHNQVRAIRDKICKQVKQWHKNTERLRDKERLDRLAALKSNDFEKYREYVNNAKNERLMELITKTDTYLSTLAAKMATATKDVGSKNLLELEHDVLPLAGGEEKAEEGKGEGEEKKEKEGKEKELENALKHAVTETVLEQPKICGGKELRLKPYQIQGVQWMISLYNNNLSGILADEMGLGKTIQVVGLLTYVMETKQDPGPFMIIAPLSTITNWSNEFERWAPTVEVVVYKGTKDVRKNLYKNKMKTGQFNVMIIQYEMVMKQEDMRHLKNVKWSYIVVDEGHRLKNKDSRLFMVLMKEYVSKRKLILTGTPLQNNINELWNLLNFLMPQVFDTDQDFKSWFSKPFAIDDANQDDDEEGTSNEEQMVLINRLHQVLRPFMLRRVKSDKELELSMPDNREVIIKTPLSGLQSIMYRQLQHSVLRGRDDKGNVNTKTYNNIIIRLRQVCAHPYLLNECDLGDENRIRVCGKLDVLDRILPKLKACGHRVLIYSQMTKLLDILEEYLLTKDFVYRKLVGATASDERAKLIADFNRPDSDIFLFLLSTRAGGQGVNLQTADTVIIFDSDWNPMMDEQAKARINRIGQKKQTLVIRLVTPSTVEERMLNRANARLRMGDLAIEGGVFKVGATSKEAQEVVRQKLDEGDMMDDIANIDFEVAGDEQINEMLMRNQEEFEVWQDMDEERLRREKREGKTEENNSRLMPESEVPEEILGRPLSTGERVQIVQSSFVTKAREGVVVKKGEGNEYVVRFDDGATESLCRSVLDGIDEPEEVDEEVLKLGRRKAVVRGHSVSHHGLTDAEFTRCLEQDIDINDYLEKKRRRESKGDGAVSGGESLAGRKRRKTKSGDDSD